MARELTAAEVRREIDPSVFQCNSTEQMSPVSGIVGQERALTSLKFGLGIPRKGFNVFIVGSTGTGRTTAIRQYLKKVAADKNHPGDWCYVNNFDDPYRPRVLKLPAGKGKRLKKDMEKLVEEVGKVIAQVFTSKEYIDQRTEITERFTLRREAVMEELRQKAQNQDLLIQNTPFGVVVIPAQDKKPMSEEDYNALSEDVKTGIKQRRENLAKEIQDSNMELLNEQRSMEKEIEENDREMMQRSLDFHFESLRREYHDLPRVLDYLTRIEKDMIENYTQFTEQKGEQTGLNAFLQGMGHEEKFRNYQVNLIVDNSELSGAPVILELNPTYQNLVGRIEKEARFGMLSTDFTQIRAGSLHRANGGFIALKIEDILANYQSWDALKRSIRDQRVEIEEIGERLGFISTRSLRPEPIELDMKIIIIGEPMYYYLLYRLDSEFKELFKVKADFDTRMSYDAHLEDYVGVICKLRNEENLRHLDKSAIARIIEHSLRLSGDRDKLSSFFTEITDMVREADFWAAEDGSTLITREHVKKAIDEKIYRSNLIQERINEMIANGTLMVSTEGTAVGQSNGLSVLFMGDYAFGRPTRITATIGLGREGLIDIEREVKLGGPLHSKGVMILAGFIAERYTRDTPLSLSARLVFEQSYEGIEGDSASGAELYALLSALTDVPLRQDIAITGSINQKGGVQAIGGINEKIEGFYDVCKVRGLTGSQGVIMPESNIRHLMLREDVTASVAEGTFHIYPVSTVEEAMGILTGKEMGSLSENGIYPPGSLNQLIQTRLEQMARRYVSFTRSFSGEEKS
jgi:lon-related putative ATP-dependent protease